MLFSARSLLRKILSHNMNGKTVAFLFGCLILIIPLTSPGDVSEIQLTPAETSWLNAKHTVRIRIAALHHL